jgi:hypothetical protein
VEGTTIKTKVQRENERPQRWDAGKKRRRSCGEQQKRIRWKEEEEELRKAAEEKRIRMKRIHGRYRREEDSEKRIQRRGFIVFIVYIVGKKLSHQ